MEASNHHDEVSDNSRQDEMIVREFPPLSVVTLPFLGVQSVWSTEMAFGWLCSLHLT